MIQIQSVVEEKNSSFNEEFSSSSDKTGHVSLLYTIYILNYSPTILSLTKKTIQEWRFVRWIGENSHLKSQPSRCLCKVSASHLGGWWCRWGCRWRWWCPSCRCLHCGEHWARSNNAWLPHLEEVNKHTPTEVADRSLRLWIHRQTMIK